MWREDPACGGSAGAGTMRAGERRKGTRKPREGTGERAGAQRIMAVRIPWQRLLGSRGGSQSNQKQGPGSKGTAVSVSARAVTAS